MSVRRSASGDGCKFFGVEACEDEVVDFVARPGFVGDFGDRGLHRRDERPMLGVGRTLLDPALEQFLLLGLELRGANRAAASSPIRRRS